jgi:AraC-like DNA-binding protein
VAAVRDLEQLPVLTPELLLGSAPPLPPVGPVRLTLSDAPAREQPSLLRECLARVGLRYEVEPLKLQPFHVDLLLNRLLDLRMTTGQMYGSSNRRTRAHCVDDDAVLIVNLRGPHLIEQRNEEVVLGDGEAILVSGADPSCFTPAPPGDVLALRFPKNRLTSLLSGGPDRFMQRIPRGTPALEFLTSYVAFAWHQRSTAGPELQHVMATHIFDLMAVMIGATRDAAETAQCRGIRAARLQEIKQDIAKNLGRPDLSVAILADRHGCTPRFVQRLFETEGTTFTEYVLTQRLARAYRLLSDPSREGEKIRAVAYDAGFGDVSYFNRVFRRHYGAAPSEIRAQARKTGSDWLM